jgi:Kef-type K+ transport system membrane component KefB
VLRERRPVTDQEVQLFPAGLAIIILLARLLGMAAKRLGQPPVVGEIIAGIMLEPTLFHGKSKQDQRRSSCRP